MNEDEKIVVINRKDFDKIQKLRKREKELQAEIRNVLDAAYAADPKYYADYEVALYNKNIAKLHAEGFELLKLFIDPLAPE